MMGGLYKDQLSVSHEIFAIYVDVYGKLRHMDEHVQWKSYTNLFHCTLN